MSQITTTKVELDTVKRLLGSGWGSRLAGEFNKPYMERIRSALTVDSTFHTVYPEKANIFRAYRETDILDARVLILGQDPYHNGAATGLAFEVAEGFPINPSLRNIYKEIKGTYGKPQREDGNLTHWAKQGVLLLNTILTVPKGEPKGHADYGWDKFICATFEALTWRNSDAPLVVMLWGKEAQQYANFFPMPHHLVLTAPHPAAEAYSGGKAGFFGSHHFTKANTFLEAYKYEPIKW